MAEHKDADMKTVEAAGVAASEGAAADATAAAVVEVAAGSASAVADAPERAEAADGDAAAVDAAPAASASLASATADQGADADHEDDEVESEDSLTYSNGVIEKIVAMATREVPHVLGMKGNLMHFVQEQFGAENLTKGVTVEVTDDNRVIVNISVIIEYGSYAPDIFEDVKERVTERLAAMTGLEIAGINLRIEDVVTRAEFEARQKHPADAPKPEQPELSEA